MTPLAGVTGVVLAGGRATRMGGIDKARIPLPEAAETLGRRPPTPLSRILDVFAGRFTACILVGTRLDHEAPLPVTATADRFEGCGPLGGLHAALSILETPSAFVCGCDMPSLSGPLIDFMIARSRPDRLLVPVRRGRPEPLHALYPASCLESAEKALSDGVRMMLDFFERVPVDYLPEEEFSQVPGADRSFDNINTQADLENWRP